MRVCVATLDGIKVAGLAEAPYVLVYELGEDGRIYPLGRRVNPARGSGDAGRLRSLGCEVVVAVGRGDYIVEEGVEVWEALRRIASRLGPRA